MNIFKKIESFFGSAQKDIQKAMNSESFQHHLEQTKGILQDTEVGVEAIGREVLEKSSVLLEKIKNLAVNLERSLQESVNKSINDSTDNVEFDAIAEKIRARVNTLEVKPDNLANHIQDIDFEEIKQEYEETISNKSMALIVHKDQLVADLKKNKENLEGKIQEVKSLIQLGNEKEKIVHEAKIIDMSQQARLKANELLSGFRKEKESFDQTVNDFNEKIARKFSTHMDKLREVDRSVKSDFDRLIDKMKDKLGDE